MLAKIIISYLAGCRFLQPLQPFPFGRRALMVAVGPNMVWAVDTSNDIFKLNGGQWQHIPGKLKSISVGVSHVWGVNPEDKIHTIYPGRGDWEYVEGRLKQVRMSHK